MGNNALDERNCLAWPKTWASASVLILALAAVHCGSPPAGAVIPGEPITVPDGASPGQDGNGSAQQPGATDDAPAGASDFNNNLLQGKASMGPGATPPLVALRSEIEAASAATGVAANVLAAVIWAESRGDVDVAGGGLMQIGENEFAQEKRAHAEIIGSREDAGANVMAGAFYLVTLQGEMKQKFGRQDLGITLRAYNSGGNGVDPNDLSALPAGTGYTGYVDNVRSFATIVATGEGSLPP